MKLSERQQIFTRNVARLIAKADELGIALTFGEAYRTQDQQLLYYHGLTLDEHVRLTQTTRRSWTKEGYHQKRLAVDFNHFVEGGKTLTWKKEDLQALGDYWESLHPSNRWGGNFSAEKLDVPHYEMRL